MRQQDSWRVLARGFCIVLDLLLLGLFVATTPAYFAQLMIACPAASATCGTGQLYVDNIGALHTLGLSLNGYAALIVSFVCLSELLCVIVAALLLWRKADNWSALVVAVMLVGLGTSYSTPNAAVVRPFFGPVLATPIAHIADYFGALALPLIFSLFPNGHFVPRWTRWLVLLMLCFGVVIVSFPEPPAQIRFLSPLLWIVSICCLFGAQIYRYRYVSSLVERQQTKWVLFGFAVVLSSFFVLLLPELIFPSLARSASPYVIFDNIINTFNLTLPLALTFVVAIFRYRLYDIDLLINRTLVYSMLTATLVFMYLAIVLGLQWLLNVFTGQVSPLTHTPVVVVASTLTIAALFQPLRRSIQTIIDRRFYRSKYDAARTVASFSEALQSEVNLEQLREHLITVVEETMRPTHVSLWLRSAESSAEITKEQKTRLLPRIEDHERK